MTDITTILGKIEAGDPAAADELLPLVYDELRRLAAARMVEENPGHTLQATALVHEAYLRLVDVDRPREWQSRAHFFRAAALAMRRILVDTARRKGSLKAGGALNRVDLEKAEMTLDHSPNELLMLDEAVTSLTAEDPMAGELAKLRLFAGLSVEEAAEVLGLSRRNAFRQWTYVRAFLQMRIQADDSV